MKKILLIMTFTSIAFSAPSLKKIQKYGDMSDGQYYTGAAVGSLILPFGIGQAIQGRYGDTGWIFTVSQIASIALIAAGGGSCEEVVNNGATVSSTCDGNETLPLIGIVGLAGSRLWEIIDLWARGANLRSGYKKRKSSFQFLPTIKDSKVNGAIASLDFRF